MIETVFPLKEELPISIVQWFWKKKIKTRERNDYKQYTTQQTMFFSIEGIK